MSAVAFSSPHNFDHCYYNMSLLAYEFASGFHGLKGSVAAFVGDYLNEPTVGSANGLFRRAIGDEPVTIYSGLPLEPEGAPNSRFAVALLTGLIGFLGVALVSFGLGCRDGGVMS